ncbi:MgtC/SapB family protein [Ruficoccus amylovorans]|uniref:MgtC/SapB family protein n=1 Tax=Ruficoccus amylovorans TaxID=1804625 RepID=A0A842HE31_9BACT|nr:MgtC/SapB family protein [Ruficoccus amylovorans]MBC2593926.1 MgtC/SapB family protein [Ruficoccus amylovorans]
MPEIPTDQWAIMWRVALAAVLAGLPGLEREFRKKPAGFRTHMIIGASCALLVLLGSVLLQHYSQTVPASEQIRTDPLRLFEAIVVGVSFIGAGTILKVEGSMRIRFLTTAASLLFAAAIGISVALSLFYLAVFECVLILVINQVLGRLEKEMS